MSLQNHPLIADWITARNGRLVIHTGKVDIGQRISTALIQIAHEELTVPLDLIDVAPVCTGHAPDEGITSGSNSIEQSGHALRCAALTLRECLIQLAQDRAGGAIADWQLESGVLRLGDTNHRIDLIDLMPDVARDIPVKQGTPVAPRTDRILPRPEMRGLRDMVRGTFTYIHDLDRPGMLHARVIRPPHAGAVLRKIDAKKLRTLEEQGFSIIRDGSFLALAGRKEWPVIKATTLLHAACDWDRRGGLPEIDVFQELSAANAQRFLVVDGTPTTVTIPQSSLKPDYSARYERPYQLHGSLAPSAALAHWSGKKLDLLSHSQGIYPLRESICDSLGLPQDKVEITHVPGSGCYGHTGADDAAFEACLIAMALPDTPILLKWTREEEHAWEPYAPAMAVDLAANIVDGKVASYSADVFSDTHRGRPRPGPNRTGPARLLANHYREDPIGPIPAVPNLGRHAGMHRNLDPIYTFPERRLVKNLVSGLPLRTSAMRCLGAAANVFALESFMDELAHRQSVPPLAFRRAHIEEPRALAVLAELERQLSARPDMADGCGRGVAFAQYKNTMTRVGISVDLEVNDRAEIRLLDALIVADAGRVIDADGLTAQLEGGFLQAASWALYEQVTWDRDGIGSRDWASYPVIRFDNVPNIEVTLLDDPNAASVGAGEASPGPAIAAIANAIFDATNIRMRRMPFTPEAIQQMAAAE
ncbi:molybdopterin cofactor-binding domain-containing protein [Litoreibacter janthinus]|uniref:CO or xanthine dehydrogenase, Mo-binding subunit n=1 Tax=Litoreibacter janthinus TaxID=670154 RepID=A0A1I6GX65_9RHOB|nr:molybdopterin cofactor-binding domain-containing protein [Litoreibacter janthinus]SFR46825.1 CO or xanthine dehydrogenase, Mo-binding subunit [Litoreibacter janthinus]